MHHSPEPNFNLSFLMSYIFDAFADYTVDLEHHQTTLEFSLETEMSKIITLPAGSLLDWHKNLMDT